MNKRNNDGDDNVVSYPMFTLMAKPTNVEYMANINKEFVHSEQFDEIVHAMEGASEGDSFTINLTTPGGALQAVIPLLNAMEDTLAHVHVHIASDVASAGTLLLMKADSVSINDYAEVMLHQVSFGAGGPGHNVEQRVTHTLKSSKALCRELYKHFLTPAEIEAMLTGTDWYFGKEEFITRYNKRAQLLGEEIEAKIAEIEAAAMKPAKRVRKATAPKKVVDVVESV